MKKQIIKPPIIDTYICNKISRQVCPFSPKSYQHKFLAVGTRAGNVYHALLKFDLSELPYDLTILNSTLNIYLAFNDYPTVEKLVELFQILSDWNTQNVSFSSELEINPHPLVSQSINCLKNTFISFDVTSLVQGWNKNPRANFGIMLKIMQEDTNNKIYFLSRKYQNPNYWPYLEVHYLPSGSSAPSCNKPLDVRMNVTTQDSYKHTPRLCVLSCNYSCLVINEGDQPAQVYLQVSPDGKRWMTESTISAIQPKQTLFFIPDTLSKYVRLCYQSTTPGKCTTLTIYVQGDKVKSTQRK